MKLYFPVIILLVAGLLLPAIFFGHPAAAQCYDEIAPNVKVPCAGVGFLGGPAGRASFGGFVQQLIEIALLVVGSLAVLSLIIGGFRYVTAYGNEEQLESAKRIVKNSIVGLLIVILSFVMVRVIANFLITGFI